MCTVIVIMQVLAGVVTLEVTRPPFDQRLSAYVGCDHVDYSCYMKIITLVELVLDGHRLQTFTNINAL